MTIHNRAPRMSPRKVKFKKKGLLIVYTGLGKGKTTAAFGTALRAVGRNRKVAIVQFLKGKWKSGEEKALQPWKGKVSLFRFGSGFTWEKRNSKKDIKTARQAWQKCVNLLHDHSYDVVVFDEILYGLNYKFLNLSDVLAELKSRPPLKHVILTGRNAPREIVHLADLVTEMKCVKHPYEKGISAQPGIDY